METFKCISTALDELVKQGREKHPQLKPGRSNTYYRNEFGHEYACFIGFAALGAGASLEDLAAWENEQGGTAGCLNEVEKDLFAACPNLDYQDRHRVSLFLNALIEQNDSHGLDYVLEKIKDERYFNAAGSLAP